LSLRATEEECGNLAAEQEIASSLRPCNAVRIRVFVIGFPHAAPRFSVSLPPASLPFPGDRSMIRIQDVEAACSKLQGIFDPQGRMFILIAR